MILRIQRLGRIFDPESNLSNSFTLTHAANPVLVPIASDIYRIFFNSRDALQRSSVYSVDFNLQELMIVEGSLREQYILSAERTYFRDGISLGSPIKINHETWIGFMAWINPPNQHWFGTIGKFKLDRNFNIAMIDENPWFDLDSNDPISLSYPAFYEKEGQFRMWYGSTITWDAGNGEMLHILKEKSSPDCRQFLNTGRTIKWKINDFQAFSRPSIIQVQNIYLMAYSVRGYRDRYRIEFSVIDDTHPKKNLDILQLGSFSASGSDWESEMVEYPFLVTHKDDAYMFYNGNGYGRTGIGVAKVLVT